MDQPALSRQRRVAADRADAHDRRVDARVGVSSDFRQHGQAEGLGFFGAHQDHGGGTVVQGRGVTGGHRTVLLEGRFQFAQRFSGGAGAWLFVGLAKDSGSPLR